MKQLTRAFSYKTFVTFLMLTLINAVTWAQDNGGSGTGGSGSTGGSSGGGTSTSTSSTTSITQTDTWYTQPWVWVVGGIILLLLIVALTRGNSSTGRSDKVTVSKSVRTDTDV